MSVIGATATISSAYGLAFTPISRGEAEERWFGGLMGREGSGRAGEGDKERGSLVVSNRQQPIALPHLKNPAHKDPTRAPPFLPLKTIHKKPSCFMGGVYLREAPASPLVTLY